MANGTIAAHIGKKTVFLFWLFAGKSIISYMSNYNVVDWIYYWNVLHATVVIIKTSYWKD